MRKAGQKASDPECDLTYMSCLIDYKETKKAPRRGGGYVLIKKYQKKTKPKESKYKWKKQENLGFRLVKAQLSVAHLVLIKVQESRIQKPTVAE
jgi:hypothetical protein